MARRPLPLPDRATITDDTPLRLEVAAALAFPDGGIKGSSLRLEAGKGRLDVFLIAGRYFTTLAAVARMVEACRVSHRPALQPASDDDGRAATANACRALEERIAAISARQAVEKQARKKERDAERIKALAIKRKTRPRGRAKKPLP